MIPTVMRPYRHVVRGSESGDGNRECMVHQYGAERVRCVAPRRKRCGRAGWNMCSGNAMKTVE